MRWRGVIVLITATFGIAWSRTVPAQATVQPGAETPAKAQSDQSLWKYNGFVREVFHGAQSAFADTPGAQDDLIASYSRVRAEASYKEGPVKAEASLNADAIFSNYQHSPEFNLAWNTLPRNRLFYLERNWDNGDYMLRSSVHRLSVTYSTSPHILAAGRQAVSWGEGRFLNPMDLVTPVDPFIVDLEDVPGADALNYTYFLNQVDSLQGVIVPLRRADDPDLKRLQYRDTNALGRYKATYGITDFVLVGGRHYHSWVSGLELSVSKWDMILRASVLGRSEDRFGQEGRYDPSKLPPRGSWQGVLGASYAFGGKLRTTVEVFATSSYTNHDPDLAKTQQDEALVSAGFQQPEADDRPFFRTNGRIITKNPVLWEASVGYPFTSDLNGDLFVIVDPYQASAFYGAVLSWNVTDDCVWVLGLRLFTPHRDDARAEFQTGRPSAYTYLRFHF